MFPTEPDYPRHTVLPYSIQSVELGVLNTFGILNIDKVAVSNRSQTDRQTHRQNHDDAAFSSDWLRSGNTKGQIVNGLKDQTGRHLGCICFK
ncbi:hypothetical protein J6590_056779 [Homalodisca vitripennis]|nr:hypothetical protein J6590_056779 [Homalodisca vitripennis]